MEQTKKRPLDEAERKTTTLVMKQHENDLELLKWQEKKQLLEIEGVPLIERQYQQQLKNIQANIKTTEQAIADAKETLQRK